MCFPNNMEVLLSEEFSLMKNKFTLGAFIRADKPTAHIFHKTQRVSFLTSTRRQLRHRQRSLADICLREGFAHIHPNLKYIPELREYEFTSNPKYVKR